MMCTVKAVTYCTHIDSQTKWNTSVQINEKFFCDVISKPFPANKNNQSEQLACASFCQKHYTKTKSSSFQLSVVDRNKAHVQIYTLKLLVYAPYPLSYYNLTCRNSPIPYPNLIHLQQYIHCLNLLVYGEATALRLRSQKELIEILPVNRLQGALGAHCAESEDSGICGCTVCVLGCKRERDRVSVGVLVV
jgi:hypothetical protein